MERGLPVTLLCLALAVAPAAAQQPLDGPSRPFQDSLFAQLAGSWTVTGPVHGQQVTYALRAEWVLNHQFLRLDMRDVAEPPAYQAHVYIGYDNTSSRYVAHWLDGFGGRWSETLGYGQRSGTAAEFVFEYPDGPFHTTFTLDPQSGTWSVLMRDRAPDGAWREFGHLQLRRS
jgi:hypothetical protein